ncbi:MAG: hypothetical protein AAFX50_17245, partial [Acidobacteriota bacterium]
TPVDGDARRTIVEAELDAAVAGLDAELRRERLDAMAPDVFTFVRATAAKRAAARKLGKTEDRGVDISGPSARQRIRRGGSSTA